MDLFSEYPSQSSDFELSDDEHENQQATDENLKKMAKSCLQVSRRDGYRFPANQFGYSLPVTSRYDLNDFEKVLQRYLFLESHCEIVEGCSHSILDIDFHDVDLFQAIFFPKTISPRTAIKCEPITIMNEKSVMAMWFRWASHYFEWLTGVHEIHFFTDFDKMKIMLSNVCKIICLHVAFCNLEYFSENSDETIFLFGSGFYYDPARRTDSLMSEYCQALFVQMKRMLPRMRLLNITKKEFVLLKLAFFFDCNSFHGMSKQGVELARSLCTKYRTLLAEYVRHQVNNHPDASKLTESEKNAISMNRVRDLLDFPSGVETLSEIDNRGLADMVKVNYGGMQGKLQKQIHTESLKVSK